MKQRHSIYTIAFLAVSVFSLNACDSLPKGEAKYPHTRGGQVVYTGEEESIFGEDGMDLFGKKKDEDTKGANGIGVNSYLWQASLDTVSFMPVASADPFGGVILTDWYSPNGVETERFKVNIFLTGRRLETSALRVSIFKQEKVGDVWKDLEVTKKTVTDMEDTILSKARELRIKSTEGL